MQRHDHGRSGLQWWNLIGPKTGTTTPEKAKKSAGANRLTLRFSWLPDLGSNQGPTD